MESSTMNSQSTDNGNENETAQRATIPFFSHERLRENIHTKNGKMMFLPIRSNTEFTYAASIIEMLIHNKKTYIATRIRKTALTKAFDKMYNKRNTTISFTELQILLEGLLNCSTPLTFFIHVIELSQELKKLFDIHIGDDETASFISKNASEIQSTKDAVEDIVVTLSFPDNLMLNIAREDEQLHTISVDKYIHLKKDDGTTSNYQLESFLVLHNGQYTSCCSIEDTIFHFTNGEINICDELSVVENHAIMFLYSRIPDDIILTEERITSSYLETVSTSIINTYNMIGGDPRKRIISSAKSNHEVVDVLEMCSNPMTYDRISFTRQHSSLTPNENEILHIDEKYKNLFGCLAVPKDGIPSSPQHSFSETPKVKLVVQYLNSLNLILRKFKTSSDVGLENLQNITNHVDDDDSTSRNLTSIATDIVEYLNAEINQETEVDEEALEGFVRGKLQESGLFDADFGDSEESQTQDDENDEYAGFFDPANYNWRERAENLHVEKIPLDEPVNRGTSPSVQASDKAKAFMIRKLQSRTPESLLHESNKKWAESVKLHD